MSNLWEGMMLRVLYFYFSHVKQIIVANLMLYIDLFSPMPAIPIFPFLFPCVFVELMTSSI
jgi:hypothetical protein